MQIRIGGELFDLKEGITVVGRSADADLTIESTKLSRQHTRFVLQGNTLSVEDLGSKNGTFVNNNRIEARTELRQGDKLVLADIECEIAFPGRKKKAAASKAVKTSPEPVRSAARESAGKSRGPLKVGIAVAVIIIGFIAVNIIMNRVPEEQLKARDIISAANTILDAPAGPDDQRKRQLEDVLEELRTVPSEFPAENRQAGTLVDKARKELETIENRMAEEELVKKVTAELQDIRTQFDAGELDADEGLRRLGELFDRYAGTSMLPRISTEIQHVQDVKKNVNRQKVRQAVRDVEKLLREEQYQGAQINLGQYLAELQVSVDEADMADLVNMKDRIVQAASDRLEAEIESALRRAPREDCAVVRDELETSFRKIGLNQLKKRYKEADTKIEEIDNEKKAKARAALEKALKGELAQIEALRKKRKYLAAAKIFDSIMNRLTDQDLRNLVKEKMRINTLFAAAQEAVISFVTGRGGLTVEGLGNIVSISEETLKLMVDGSPMPLAWHVLKKDEFIELVEKTVDDRKTGILYLACGVIIMEEEGENLSSPVLKKADGYIASGFRVSPSLKEEYPGIYSAFLKRKGAAAETVAVVRKEEEERSAPGVYAFRKELVGKHPRLYFTAQEIPGFSRKVKGETKWFADKLKADFAGRSFGSGKGLPGSMEVWHQHMYGFWALTGADFLSLFENNSSYADTCRKWVLEFIKKPFWANQKGNWSEPLSHFDVVSGVAITYDVLFAQFSEQERYQIREWLMKEISFIRKRFEGTADAGYWPNDQLNNHMHNRFHGLAHAVLAMYGDDPKQDVSEYVDFVMDHFKDMLEWLPGDGSYHEGPGYWGFGYHWCLRMAFLMKHVTTADPFADNSNFSKGHLFRIYMQAPGWNQIMPIGDTGEGKGGFASLTTIAIGASAAGDLYSLDLVKTLMQAQPGGFYQQTAWGMLYYDGTSQTRSYKDLPLHCFWPDLEMFSIRSSWEDDATALVFKCGPPGGHHLQQMRKGGWANVAHDDPDQNHFLLYAHGTLLTHGDGYVGKNGGKKMAANHNTVILGGKGQGREGGGWYQPFPYHQTGYMKDVFLSYRSAFASGDASPLYPGEKFIRHIAFVDGEYVILVDELAGAGAQESFDWRLHTGGSWKKENDAHLTSTENGVLLDVQFLAPDAGQLSSSIFKKKGPVYGGISVKHNAQQATMVSLVVPSKGVPLKLEPEVKQSGGSTVVSVKGPKYTDILIVTQGGGARTDEVTLKGTAALVRLKGDKPVSALMIRGTSLKVSGEELLSSSKPANVSWHDTPKGTMVEAEGAYISRKEAKSPDEPFLSGGSATVKAADFKGKGTVYVDMEPVSSAKPGSDGTLSLKVDLSVRTTVKK